MVKCLPVETQVRSLVQEDPTYLGETKPMHATTIEPVLQSAECTTIAQHALQLLKPRAHAQQEKPATTSLCATTREQPLLACSWKKPYSSQDPAEPRNK